MNGRLASRAGGAVFLVMGAGHLLRFFLKVTVVIGGFAVPLWWSLPASLALFALAAWLWTASRPGI